MGGCYEAIDKAWKQFLVGATACFTNPLENLILSVMLHAETMKENATKFEEVASMRAKTEESSTRSRSRSGV